MLGDHDSELNAIVIRHLCPSPAYMKRSILRTARPHASASARYTQMQEGMVCFSSYTGTPHQALQVLWEEEGLLGRGWMGCASAGGVLRSWGSRERAFGIPVKQAPLRSQTMGMSRIDRSALLDRRRWVDCWFPCHYGLWPPDRSWRTPARTGTT